MCPNIQYQHNHFIDHTKVSKEFWFNAKEKKIIIIELGVHDMSTINSLWVHKAVWAIKNHKKQFQRINIMANENKTKKNEEIQLKIWMKIH